MTQQDNSTNRYNRDERSTCEQSYKELTDYHAEEGASLNWTIETAG